jgi:hypothetical protein
LANSIFKTGSKWVLGVALAIAVAWWLLPLSVTHYAEVSHGNILRQRLDSYFNQNHTLPEDDAWQQLKQIGFTSQELENAYPEYHKIDDDAYELLFVKGFDGPYLTWNSWERRWKKGYATLPVR